MTGVMCIWRVGKRVPQGYIAVALSSFFLFLVASFEIPGNLRHGQLPGSNIQAGNSLKKGNGTAAVQGGNQSPLPVDEYRVVSFETIRKRKLIESISTVY